MNKTILVALREFTENLRTKTFWVGILFFPIMLILAFAVPAWLEDKKDARLFAVLDQTDWLKSEVLEKAEAPDLEKLFLQVRSKTLADDPDPTWPPMLKAMSPILAQQTKANVIQMARGMAKMDTLMAIKPELMVQIPPQAQEEFKKQFKELKTWWHHLSADEARNLDSVKLDRQNYQHVEIPNDRQDKKAWLEEELKESRIFAYFVVDGDPVTGVGQFTYHAKNFTDDSLRNWFQRYTNEVVQTRRFIANDINEDLVAKIRSPIVFTETMTTKEGGQKTAGDEVKAHQFLPVAFVYLLWMTVFMMAQMLLTNTIEEKSNRTIEVLLSSVSPLQLMAGKIFGIAITGMTVILSWIVFFFLIVKFGLPAMGVAPSFDITPLLADPAYLGSFVCYFLMGYLLYAALLAGIGSVCNSLKEAQNLMMPVSVVLMIPLFAMFIVIQAPNGTLARVLSFIPPLTPFIMMNRAAGPPAVWEYVTTTILLLLSIAITFWAAAKVFRIGILMTGKPPRVMEIIRWIKAPVGAIPDVAKRDK